MVNSFDLVKVNIDCITELSFPVINFPFIQLFCAKFDI